jgi:signal transduction histidine kinase
MDLHETQVISLNKSYIESILLNLMTNSLRYHDPKRQLKIWISSKKTVNETNLIFRDNGIGIDMARNKDKIFGLYQRFHDYPDSKGLGLYLVKSQVESMGGKISVESEVGVGTTFTITFKNN